jgi:hypothetical protein
MEKLLGNRLYSTGHATGNVEFGADSFIVTVHSPLQIANEGNFAELAKNDSITS